MNKGLTLVEVLVVVILIAILASVLTPCIGGGRRSRFNACANNLSQLWKMHHIYKAQYNSRKSMPLVTGSEFWRLLTKIQPPLINSTMSGVFLCPVKGDSADGSCDYGGPARFVKDLGDGDPVGADLPKNHRDGSSDGGNVLRKSGDVSELFGQDWVNLTTDPLFPRP